VKQNEAASWDQKYREGSHASLAPDSFLVTAYSEFLADTQPGTALDVAGGVGRHALWLAERGWKVTLVDVSSVGVKLAQENFHLRSMGQLDSQILDLSQLHDLGHERYDLILVFFYLQRSLFPALISALRPTGFLIYKTYTTESKRLGRGPSHPMYLLEHNELLHAFESLRILHYHETTKEKGIAELVAQK
jgi:2-polyprenyl-3-methyl-5-hydroxy-6-metoxy-1,4-benzoquinol methylase